MSEVIPFDFGDTVVRVHQGNDGNPWFVAKDVCIVLEIRNSRDATSSLDDDELVSVKATSGGQHREMSAVSESGLYSLIFKSRKPEAKKFRKWITSEVIPSLRKTGCYAMGQGSSPASFDQHKELFPLLTKWGILLKEKEIWQPQEIFHQAVMALQVALGKPQDTPINSLTPVEVEYAREYLNAQIEILIGKSGEIMTPEEEEKARIRSEKARKSARARWDKAKAIGK
ncbi:Bro-N domain-containing protein [Maridesulfovibrio sp.]|uniref:BRO-N domain-containing protein n=1 Tax=Maridesulfovibrio sp. TaxID=2795000 RepID=UPI0039F0B6D2